MKLKLISLLSLIVMVICWAARYALNYDLGYYELSCAPFNYENLLVFVGAIFFPVLLITWIISLVRKEHRVWATGLVIGLLVLMAVVRTTPPPSQSVAYGLRDRLAHDHSLDNLQHFAQDFDQLPRLGSDRLGMQTGAKQFMREDLAKTGLKEKYPFLSWVKGPGFDGPSYVHEDDGVIDVRWGSSFGGHWGFSIAVKGGKIELPTEPGIKALPLSDDIYVVSESD